jgi:glycosyltransferase involved in cell wall biosynthesis
MNLVQITPGAGGMYCGGCFRDNALVAAWRRLGHNPIMLPLYLPMTLDEEDQSRGAPLFFGGINVYLQQKSSLFGKLPRWAHRILNSPKLLRLASGSAAKTRAEEVGELTLSMLQGDGGRQTRELDELSGWLKTHFKPDVVCLSNALLLGLARRLKRDLRVPVVCLLAGEDTFLDALPASQRAASWRAAQEQAADVDCFVAPSRYYGELMAKRLEVPAGRMKVVYGGINLDGFQPADRLPDPPVLGFFARMCKEKGLDTLIDAFLELKNRDKVKGLKLRVGGGLSPVDDTTFVTPLKDKLRHAGLLEEVEFCPNLTREQKLAFYRSLSVLSVPALYGEAFGLYLVEAWASGVPVVQPDHAAFPELIQMSGAGLICAPGDPNALANAIEELLLDPPRLARIRLASRQAALCQFPVDRMAAELADQFAALTSKRQGPLAHGVQSVAHP